MKTDSPHSGLRLLSEAISPHIRELAKKDEEQLIAESLARETVIKEAPVKERTGKRKLFEAELLSEGSSLGSNQDEKECLTRSLDKIVERFLERFSDKENEQFTLMDLEFTAVKRRIYDVLNVLEGVGYIQKWQKKNSYLWTSKATMEEKIMKIRRSANVDSQNQDLVATIAHSIVAKDETFDDLTSHSDNSHLESDSSILNISELSNSSLDSSSFSANSSSCSKSSSMTKNLSSLTVRFISLFFRISPVNWTLTLDEAAERLVADSGELDQTATSKSRIASIKRRLYDITNVFLALGLIEKVQVTYGTGVHLQRKSAYHWIGVSVSGDKTGSNSTSKTVLEDVTHLQQKNSIDRQCQTSPSLLRSLIADIHAELDEARAHDSISLSVNCPTCLNQLHRHMPALCPHCRAHLPAATNNALSESSNSMLLTKQKLMFSPLPSSPLPSDLSRRQMTSTPLAGVSKIASKFCKISSNLSSGTFAANRKRKSSAPVFSNRMPPNFAARPAMPQNTFMTAFVKKPLASKTLNFASPIAPNEIERQRKPSRNGANVHFLLPKMEIHLPASPKRVKDDSGLGPSPSLFPSNVANQSVKNSK